MTAIDIDPRPLSPEPGSAPADRRIVIWPHRALSRLGTRVLVGSVALAMGLLSARAALAGAWPAVLYPLLALFGFAFALRQNNRAAHMAEVIELQADTITVRECGPVTRDGEVVGEFNPCWVRVREQTVPGSDTSRLVLTQSGRSLEIGHFLSQAERQCLARDLEETLARCYPMRQAGLR